MRAAVITSTDDPPAARDFADPAASEGVVVVDVRVAGVNPVDLYRASGELGDIPVPSIAGSEGVGDLDDGRRVYFASTVAPYGSIAQRALIDPAQAFDVPDGLDDADAVTLGIAGLAGWLPAAHHAGVSGGERVLVLGATGIAGQLAVQAAKLLGAGHVAAAGRHAGTLEPLRERGADDVVVLGDDPGGALGKAAGQDGFDVVLDYVYGGVFAAALPHTADHARLVVVGGSAGQEATVPFRDLQARTVIGHANWSVPLDVRHKAYNTMAEHVLAGRLGVEVQRFALDDVGEAWEEQASSPHRKLVVVP